MAERCEQLTFGNGWFLGINSTGLVVRSTDGLTWQRDTVGTNLWLGKISFVNGLFLVGVQRRTIIASTYYYASFVFASRYGTNWTAHPVPQLQEMPFIIAGYRQRVIAGSSGLYTRLVQSDLFPLLRMLRGDDLEIHLSAAPGNYRLESSAGPDGPWEFLTNVTSGGRILQAADGPQRYYRARSP